jgi:phage tail sheath protein FI
MIALLSNKDDYKYNVLVTPGLYKADYSSTVSNIILNTQNRGDAIYVTDMVGYGSNVGTAVTNASSIDNSYATTYWPWLQIADVETDKNVWVPASSMMPGVYAYNDSVAAEWFAPAGFNRGGLSTVLRVEQKLSQSNRDTLYLGKVNPIATFPGQGIVVFGQKTLQTKASALDRVNVRRLLISLKNYIGGISNNLVFEQNSVATRNSFLSQVNPYLASVQQRQGLYAYKVVMDESNNTADVIDRNQLVGAIYIQPTKTAEFVVLNFNILPTGASFE